MTSAPRGELFSSVLNQLLAPHGDIDRKRVTLLFRPLDPGAAGRTVENDKRNADFRISAAQKPSARAPREARAAEATAREEAAAPGWSTSVSSSPPPSWMPRGCRTQVRRSTTCPRPRG